MISKKISDKFLSNIGLFENMFGKYSNLVIINQDNEKIKKILSEVYGYKDIWDFIPQELDDETLQRTLNTIFTYHEKEEQEKIK